MSWYFFIKLVNFFVREKLADCHSTSAVEMFTLIALPSHTKYIRCYIPVVTAKQLQQHILSSKSRKASSKQPSVHFQILNFLPLIQNWNTNYRGNFLGMATVTSFLLLFPLLFFFYCPSPVFSFFKKKVSVTRSTKYLTNYVHWRN